MVETGSRETVDYTFTGYEQDAALDMLDAGARFYNSSLCQFAGVDPVDPAGISSYSYARNNPLNFFDPDGRQDKKAQPKGTIDASNIGDTFADIRWNFDYWVNELSRWLSPQYVQVAFDSVVTAEEKKGRRVYTNVIADKILFKWAQRVDQLNRWEFEPGMTFEWAGLKDEDRELFAKVLLKDFLELPKSPKSVSHFIFVGNYITWLPTSNFDPPDVVFFKQGELLSNSWVTAQPIAITRRYGILEHERAHADSLRWRSVLLKHFAVDSSSAPQYPEGAERFWKKVEEIGADLTASEAMNALLRGGQK